MPTLRIQFALAFVPALDLALAVSALAAGELSVSPQRVALVSPEASQQLLVSAAGRDRTRAAHYESTDQQIATVTAAGRVRPRQDGRAEIIIRDGSQSLRVAVEVSGLASPEPVSFRGQVLPILSKAGCNSGGCHGKAGGQNGFQLSVFGYDAAADYAALVKQARGRRVSLAAPQQSLLLRKSTAELPHGGGRKIEEGSLWHQLLTRWLQEGARLDSESAPRVAAIEVEPAEAVLDPHSTQQLRVTAVDSRGRRRCVTPEAEYQSNADAIAAVDPQGLITGTAVPGEAAILVRYMGQVAVCRATLPQSEVSLQRPAEGNFVDRHVWNKLQRLGVRPSPLCDDATFLRRAFLDVTGCLPTADEARQFLDDKDPAKRSRLIDRLLERDEYADYWAMLWADLLRVDSAVVTPQGAVAMTRWLRSQFQQNTRYDELARAIITARGNTLAEGPAAFYQVHQDAETAGRAVSQLFLGVRIECSQCHHHPFDRWSQQDYFAFAGFFTGVARKGSPTGGQKIVAEAGSDLVHPRTEQLVPPAGIGAAPAELDGQLDRRVVLADWITSADNPYFARMIANRLWAHYFGRGLVEPVDDMRATNPATNEPLLDALAAHLIELDYDLKAFTRTLLNSRAYQLDWRVDDSNRLDGQSYSHAAWKPLPAEVLLDAVCQATGVPQQFNGWPEGRRAVQVWDSRLPSYFFRTFGRPQRVSVCQCERGSEPSIAQALHLMNSPETMRKIEHRDGRAAELARSPLTDEQVIEALYLTCLSRRPAADETALMQQAFPEQFFVPRW